MPTRMNSGESPLPGGSGITVSPHGTIVSSHGGGGEGALWGLLYKDTNPIHDLITSPNHLPNIVGG